MKLLSSKEAKELYLDGNEIWYYIEGEFEVSDEEKLKLDKQMNNTFYLEHYSESGVAQMTCIGMETQGDSKEDFDKSQTYFSDEEYHYMIHQNLGNEFVELYDTDDWYKIAEKITEHDAGNSEKTFVASNKLIEGYKEITCYSAMMLKSVGVEPIVLSEKVYTVMTYDTEPIAVIESTSVEEMGKLMTKAISEHLSETCTIIDWEIDSRVRFSYVNEDEVTCYDSFAFHVLPKYSSDEN